MNETVDYEILVKPPVVYGVPIVFYGPDDIERYYDALIESASDLPQWILFENPQCSAAMTTEAAQAMLFNYKRLAAKGCVGIAVLLTNAVVGVVRQQKSLAGLSIPFSASRNPIELSHFVEDLVSELTRSKETQQSRA